MKYWVLIPIIVLIVLLSTPTIEAQDDDSIVFEITNLYLPKNETYSQHVSLVPYAPHNLEFEVSHVNTSISNTLATIWLHSDKGSIGLYVYHHTSHRNSSYTPRTSDFTLDIENKGYVDIFINFTITQTGDQITAFYEPEDVKSEVIIPVVGFVILPIIIPIIIIALYRRLRFSNVTIDKLTKNAKLIAYGMIGVTLLSPQNFYIYSDNYDPLILEISGSIWRYWSNRIPSVMFGFMGDPIATFLGFVFSYGIYRCYQAKCTRKRAVIVGLLSLIWQFFPVILNLIFYPIDPSSPFLDFYGPIPSFFVLGATLLFLLPPPEPPKTWDEELEYIYEV